MKKWGKLKPIRIDENEFKTDLGTNNFILKNSPHPQDRAIAMEKLFSYGYKTYVTIEPIMDFNLFCLLELIKMCNSIQVNIGADSGNNHLPEPPKEKILELIHELEKFTKVVKKKNLNRLLK